MSEFTPYAPVADGNLPLRSNPYAAVEAEIVESMKRTRPWVLFMSILGYIAGVMSGLVSVGFIALTALAPSSPSSHNDVRAMGPLMSVAYLVLAGLCVPPSYLLGAYASSISRYVSSGGPLEGLADAVRKQASYWRYIGISTVVLISLYALILVGALVVGVVVGMNQR